MSTHILIFAVIGILATAAVGTFCFFAGLKRANKFLNDYAQRRESDQVRDRYYDQRRRAWARFKCHRTQRLQSGRVTHA